MLSEGVGVKIQKMTYYGGCEGGGSKTNLIICDANGKILGEANGPSTNQWLIGLDECCKRINDLVNEAKTKAGLAQSDTLECLGLSLSGADGIIVQEKIAAAVLTAYPNIAKHCFTCNDTLSPLVTATDGGGVVLIAGTGSNCLLVDESGTLTNCGGWGHMIGDQGGAFWIAMEAIRMIFYDSDGYVRAPYNTETLKKLMFEHFQMQDMFGILPHLYPPNNGQLDKKHLALFCQQGVVKAAESNDQLALHVLSLAGEELGRHVKALITKMSSELLNEPGGLKIICVGSVWKSWSYLKDGFVKGLSPQTDEEKQLKEFSLLRLKPDAKPSVGSAAWACKKANLPFHLDYSIMSDVFFSHRF